MYYVTWYIIHMILLVAHGCTLTAERSSIQYGSIWCAVTVTALPYIHIYLGGVRVRDFYTVAPRNTWKTECESTSRITAQKQSSVHRNTYRLMLYSCRNACGSWLWMWLHENIEKSVFKVFLSTYTLQILEILEILDRRRPRDPGTPRGWDDFHRYAYGSQEYVLKGGFIAPKL